jgi:hypothetical protein
MQIKKESDKTKKIVLKYFFSISLLSLLFVVSIVFYKYYSSYKNFIENYIKTTFVNQIIPLNKDLALLIAPEKYYFDISYKFPNTLLNDIHFKNFNLYLLVNQNNNKYKFFIIRAKNVNIQINGNIFSFLKSFKTNSLFDIFNVDWKNILIEIKNVSYSKNIKKVFDYAKNINVINDKEFELLNKINNKMNGILKIKRLSKNSFIIDRKIYLSNIFSFTVKTKIFIKNNQIYWKNLSYVFKVYDKQAFRESFYIFYKIAASFDVNKANLFILGIDSSDFINKKNFYSILKDDLNEGIQNCKQKNKENTYECKLINDIYKYLFDLNIKTGN